MALKIIKSSEPITVKQIVAALYGQPGIGKSSLAYTSEAPLALDFDKGAHRAKNRGDTVSIDSWPEIANITESDLEDYKTIIVDTAGRALDALTIDIIKADPKMGYGGALTLRGYGQLKAKFTAWLTLMRSFGKDVILIAHLAEDKKGDDIIERIDVQGGSKGEIYKSADAMGKIYIENKKRLLNFSPTDAAFGKNPADLPILEIPHYDKDHHFLAGIIEMIKMKLNEMTAEQTKRKEEIQKWLDKIQEAESIEDYNNLVASCKFVDGNIAKIVKGSLHKAATESKLKFDTDQGCYIEAENENV